MKPRTIKIGHAARNGSERLIEGETQKVAISG
jgi:hypothetical protein